MTPAPPGILPAVAAPGNAVAAQPPLSIAAAAGSLPSSLSAGGGGGGGGGAPAQLPGGCGAASLLLSRAGSHSSHAGSQGQAAMPSGGSLLLLPAGRWRVRARPADDPDSRTSTTGCTGTGAWLAASFCCRVVAAAA